MPCAFGLLGALCVTPAAVLAGEDATAALPDVTSPGAVPDDAAPTPPMHTATTGSAQTWSFDIPGQALASALEQYGEISGRPVFFDSAMVAGRTSAAVRGRYTSQAALRILLEGTGLSADYSGAGETEAFVLKPADVVSAAPVSSPPDLPGASAYDGLVQSGIREALCDDPLTRPGEYRSAIRFEIDAAGRLANPRLIHASGNVARDRAMLAQLRKVRFDAPPPAAVATPLYMVILPRAAADGPECRPRP